MKLALLPLLVVLGACATAPTVPPGSATNAPGRPRSISCPEEVAVSGTSVRVRGDLVRDHEDMLLVSRGCGEQVVLKTPQQVGMERRAQTALVEQAAYRKLWKAMMARDGGHFRYSVRATVEGRLDIAEDIGIKRDQTGNAIVGINGFGSPVPFCKYRLVVASVSDVITWRYGTMAPKDLCKTP